MSLLPIALPIAIAVLKVAVVASAGWLLARRGILRQTAVTDLSALVIKAFAPCLIFASTADTTSLKAVAGLAGLVLVAAGPILLCVGYGVSAGLCRVFRVDPAYRTAVVATATYQNQLYLPLALGIAVAPGIARQLLGQGADPSTVSAAYLIALSVFGIGYGPLFWGVCLSWIASNGEQARAHPSPISVLKLIPPPVIGLIAGFVVALTPLHALLAAKSAPLRFVLDATGDLGSVTVPLANLILGAMLAGIGAGAREPLRNLVVSLGSRLIATPAICLLALYATRHLWRPSIDATVVALVIFIEAMSPPATNLATMARTAPAMVRGAPNRTAEAVPRILLVSYAAAIAIMPAWLMLFVRLAKTW